MRISDWSSDVCSSDLAEHEAKEKLIDELVRRNDFPVPESLVDRQVDTRVERGLRALAAQGMRPEDMKKMDLGERKTVGTGKRVSVRLDLGWTAIRNKNKTSNTTINNPHNPTTN